MGVMSILDFRFLDQDLRTCGELSGFRRISRGCSPQEIRQLRKCYGFQIGDFGLPVQAFARC